MAELEEAMSRWLVPTSVSVLWNIPNLPGLVGPRKSPARGEMMPPFMKDEGNARMASCQLIYSSHPGTSSITSLAQHGNV